MSNETFPGKNLRQIAENELKREVFAENKERVKELMARIQKSEKVTRNLQRELDDLLEELES